LNDENDLLKIESIYFNVLLDIMMMGFISRSEIVIIFIHILDGTSLGRIMRRII